MSGNDKPARSPAEEFIGASVWHGSLDRAREILAAHPEIAKSDVYTAALLGDDATVARYVAEDAKNATAKGGARDWDALTYLCFSRFLRLEPDRSEGFLKTARALLDAGASPNTGFYEKGHGKEPSWECALYGAAGVAHHPELTRLLIERGADPNDGEVAYHAPETLDNRTMRVLVESGLLMQDTFAMMLARKMNWHDDEGVHWLLEHGADANWSLWGSRPLHYALRHGTPLAYFEWLLDHGADARLTDKHGMTPVAEAARSGRADVLAAFENRGTVVTLEGGDAFLCACAKADEAEARRLAEADPWLVSRLQSENPGLLADFSGTGNAAAVGLMLDLGFDAGMGRIGPRWVAGETALHVATAHGCRAVAELLIERGAPLEAKRFGGQTPLGVAFQCLEKQSEWTPNEHTLPIAEALIRAGASAKDAGMTLTAAVCLGLDEDVARLARSAGSDEKQKALAAAAYNGRLDAIDRAIALGGDPNAPNVGLNPNATALHNAVCSGSLAAVERLVAAGASVEAKDGPYQASPLQWAEYFVRESGADRVEYFQREGPRPKQYAEIAAYLRGRQE